VAPTSAACCLDAVSRYGCAGGLEAGRERVQLGQVAEHTLVTVRLEPAGHKCSAKAWSLILYSCGIGATAHYKVQTPNRVTPAEDMATIAMQICTGTVLQLSSNVCVHMLHTHVRTHIDMLQHACTRCYTASLLTSGSAPAC
jgi:hypothetical protein